VPRVGPHPRPPPPVRRLAGHPRARPALHPAAPGPRGHRPLVRGPGLVLRPLPRIPGEHGEGPEQPSEPAGSLFEPPSGREREPSPRGWNQGPH
jgi:hypothetical protein